MSVLIQPSIFRSDKFDKLQAEKAQRESQILRTEQQRRSAASERYSVSHSTTMKVPNANVTASNIRAQTSMSIRPSTRGTEISTYTRPHTSAAIDSADVLMEKTLRTLRATQPRYDRLRRKLSSAAAQHSGSPSGSVSPLSVQLLPHRGGQGVMEYIADTNLSYMELLLGQVKDREPANHHPKLRPHTSPEGLTGHTRRSRVRNERGRKQSTEESAQLPVDDVEKRVDDHVKLLEYYNHLYEGAKRLNDKLNIFSLSGRDQDDAIIEEAMNGKSSIVLADERLAAESKTTKKRIRSQIEELKLPEEDRELHSLGVWMEKTMTEQYKFEKLESGAIVAENRTETMVEDSKYLLREILQRKNVRNFRELNGFYERFKDKRDHRYDKYKNCPDAMPTVARRRSKGALLTEEATTMGLELTVQYLRSKIEEVDGELATKRKERADRKKLKHSLSLSIDNPTEDTSKPELTTTELDQLVAPPESKAAPLIDVIKKQHRKKGSLEAKTRDLELKMEQLDGQILTATEADMEARGVFRMLESSLGIVTPKRKSTTDKSAKKKFAAAVARVQRASPAKSETLILLEKQAAGLADRIPALQKQLKDAQEPTFSESVKQKEYVRLEQQRKDLAQKLARLEQKVQQSKATVSTSGQERIEVSLQNQKLQSKWKDRLLRIDTMAREHDSIANLIRKGIYEEEYIPVYTTELFSEDIHRVEQMRKHLNQTTFKVQFEEDESTRESSADSLTEQRLEELRSSIQGRKQAIEAALSSGKEDDGLLTERQMKLEEIEIVFNTLSSTFYKEKELRAKRIQMNFLKQLTPKAPATKKKGKKGAKKAKAAPELDLDTKPLDEELAALRDIKLSTYAELELLMKELDDDQTLLEQIQKRSDAMRHAQEQQLHNTKVEMQKLRVESLTMQVDSLRSRIARAAHNKPSDNVAKTMVMVTVTAPADAQSTTSTNSTLGELNSRRGKALQESHTKLKNRLRELQDQLNPQSSMTRNRRRSTRFAMQGNEAFVVPIAIRLSNAEKEVVDELNRRAECRTEAQRLRRDIAVLRRQLEAAGISTDGIAHSTDPRASRDDGDFDPSLQFSLVPGLSLPVSRGGSKGPSANPSRRNSISNEMPGGGIGVQARRGSLVIHIAAPFNNSRRTSTIVDPSSHLTRTAMVSVPHFKLNAKDNKLRLFRAQRENQLLRNKLEFCKTKLDKASIGIEDAMDDARTYDMSFDEKTTFILEKNNGKLSLKLKGIQDKINWWKHRVMSLHSGLMNEPDQVNSPDRTGRSRTRDGQVRSRSISPMDSVLEPHTEAVDGENSTEDASQSRAASGEAGFYSFAPRFKPKAARAYPTFESRSSSPGAFSFSKQSRPGSMQGRPYSVGEGTVSVPLGIRHLRSPGAAVSSFVPTPRDPSSMFRLTDEHRSTSALDDGILESILGISSLGGSPLTPHVFRSAHLQSSTVQRPHSAMEMRRHEIDNSILILRQLSLGRRAYRPDLQTMEEDDSRSAHVPRTPQQQGTRSRSRSPKHSSGSNSPRSLSNSPPWSPSHDASPSRSYEYVDISSRQPSNRHLVDDTSLQRLTTAETFNSIVSELVDPILGVSRSGSPVNQLPALGMKKPKNSYFDSIPPSLAASRMNSVANLIMPVQLPTQVSFRTLDFGSVVDLPVESPVLSERVSRQPSTRKNIANSSPTDGAVAATRETSKVRDKLQANGTELAAESNESTGEQVVPPASEKTVVMPDGSLGAIRDGRLVVVQTAPPRGFTARNLMVDIPNPASTQPVDVHGESSGHSGGSGVSANAQTAHSDVLKAVQNRSNRTLFNNAYGLDNGASGSSIVSDHERGKQFHFAREVNKLIKENHTEFAPQKPLVTEDADIESALKFFIAGRLPHAPANEQDTVFAEVLKNLRTRRRKQAGLLRRDHETSDDELSDLGSAVTKDFLQVKGLFPNASSMEKWKTQLGGSSQNVFANALESHRVNNYRKHEIPNLLLVTGSSKKNVYDDEQIDSPRLPQGDLSQVTETKKDSGSIKREPIRRANTERSISPKRHGDLSLESVKSAVYEDRSRQESMVEPSSPRKTIEIVIQERNAKELADKLQLQLDQQRARGGNNGANSTSLVDTYAAASQFAKTNKARDDNMDSVSPWSLQAEDDILTSAAAPLTPSRPVAPSPKLDRTSAKKAQAAHLPARSRSASGNSSASAKKPEDFTVNPSAASIINSKDERVSTSLPTAESNSESAILCDSVAQFHATDLLTPSLHMVAEMDNGFAVSDTEVAHITHSAQTDLSPLTSRSTTPLRILSDNGYETRLPAREEPNDSGTSMPAQGNDAGISLSEEPKAHSRQGSKHPFRRFMPQDSMRTIKMKAQAGHGGSQAVDDIIEETPAEDDAEVDSMFGSPVRSPNPSKRLGLRGGEVPLSYRRGNTTSPRRDADANWERDILPTLRGSFLGNSLNAFGRVQSSSSSESTQFVKPLIDAIQRPAKMSPDSSHFRRFKVATDQYEPTRKTGPTNVFNRIRKGRTLSPRPVAQFVTVDKSRDVHESKVKEETDKSMRLAEVNAKLLAAASNATADHDNLLVPKLPLHNIINGRNRIDNTNSQFPAVGNQEPVTDSVHRGASNWTTSQHEATRVTLPTVRESISESRDERRFSTPRVSFLLSPPSSRS